MGEGCGEGERKGGEQQNMYSSIINKEGIRKIKKILFYRKVPDLLALTTFLLPFLNVP